MRSIFSKIVAVALASLAFASGHLLPRSQAPDFSNVNAVIDGAFIIWNDKLIEFL